MMIDISKRTISVIPKPLQMKETHGFYSLNPKSAIIISEDLTAIGQYLQDYIHLDTGFTLALKGAENALTGEHNIILSTDDSVRVYG